MGERAAYRVKGPMWSRKGKWTSPMLRKQWYVGGSMDDIKGLFKAIAGELLNAHSGLPAALRRETQKIGSGMVALRNDLEAGRLTAALYKAIYHPPFDSIEISTNCDIHDHGLYEIELVSWNHWLLWHYDINGDGSERGEPRLLCEVNFIPDKTLENGGMEVVFRGDFEET